MLSHSVVSDSFATPWTVAHQAPLSMGFSRQEYWSRLPCPSPGNLLNPGIESVSFESPHWQADCLWLGHLGSLWSSQIKKKERKKKRKRDRRRLLSCRVEVGMCPGWVCVCVSVSEFKYYHTALVFKPCCVSSRWMQESEHWDSFEDRRKCVLLQTSGWGLRPRSGHWQGFLGDFPCWALALWVRGSCGSWSTSTPPAACTLCVLCSSSDPGEGGRRQCSSRSGQGWRVQGWKEWWTPAFGSLGLRRDLNLLHPFTK